MEFEKKLKRLEDLVLKMEEGKLSLEETVKNFEEGVKLSRQCQKELMEAEQKVKVLMGIDEDDKVLTKDFNFTSSYKS